ncbi:TRAP transporter small permease, partial [Acidisphaera rubrifaciens]|uniref:TRAP transporter small permease n=1 Tax=Acidisphaera rubrifaciens TaxID=50715 RepID=UPI00130E4AF1
MKVAGETADGVAAAPAREAPPLPGPLLPGPAHRFVARAERGLQLIAEVPAALLVLAEIGVLGAGVFSRYVLHSPLVWSDEVASGLFLWLAMLGAVIALQRSEHMRLTAVAASMTPAWRARTEALAAGAVALFLLMLLGPSIDYASDQWWILTPALEMHDTYRAAAMPVGAVLMVATALARLARLSWRDGAIGIGALLALGVALHLGAAR